jgi:hypothetical protein
MTYDYNYPTNGTLRTNILCFIESWLNNDMDNIELVGFSMARQTRDAKTRGGGVCLFVNTNQRSTP